jgi:hypothetical protein
MEITDEHLEWATVDRLREMLAAVNEDYKVTNTYALFTAILCWVAQRIRAQGNGPIDVRARALYDEIARERAVDPPWGLTAEGEHPQLLDFNFTERSEVQNVAEIRMTDLLIALRNAVAHGDARKILPINHNGWLVGQRFLVSATEGRRLLWTGRVDLQRGEMRRISATLAERFCAALAHARPRFADEARAVHEEMAQY